MDIGESLRSAKEISSWLHSKTNNISVPNNKRTVMAVALFQQALDISDGIVLLFDNNLPGPAMALARPLHEGYVRGLWLLEHASEEKVEKFAEGKCPKFPALLKDIGDAPETGGKFIKGMTDLNLDSFHDLTHGGMEHVVRRYSESAIEPNYAEKEIVNLIKARNQYCMLITCFLLQIANKYESIEDLIAKRQEWQGAF